MFIFYDNNDPYGLHDALSEWVDGLSPDIQSTLSEIIIARELTSFLKQLDHRPKKPPLFGESNAIKITYKRPTRPTRPNKRHNSAISDDDIIDLMRFLNIKVSDIDDIMGT